jgi:hypothetical protein
MSARKKRNTYRCLRERNPIPILIHYIHLTLTENFFSLINNPFPNPTEDSFIHRQGGEDMFDWNWFLNLILAILQAIVQHLPYA